MKATGVIRRIDELGRIVIPKEIRKNLKIREGENLEIFTDENENIIFKKFSPMYKLGDYANKYVNAISNIIPYNILITDRDKIVAAGGPDKRKYLNQNISNYLEKLIIKRENVSEYNPIDIYFISEELEKAAHCINNIIVDGDVVGLVIIFASNEKLNEGDEKIIKIAAEYFSEQLKH